MARSKADRLPDQTGRRFARSLVTPEGVDLGVRIASASERAGAFMIDATIIAAILIAMTLFVALAGVAGIRASGDFSGGQVAAVIWLVGFFVLRNFYFFLFEVGARAATPGKRILRIRVAARDGGVLGANAVFARNAMREVEVFLPISFLISNARSIDGVIGLAGFIWCGVFILFPLFNRDRLRAGDLIAGTWVVQAPRKTLLPDLTQATPALRAMAEAGRVDAMAFRFTREQLDVYGIRELQVLEDLLRTPKPEALAVVAARIRAKIGWTPAPGEQDRAFLSAYYAGLRGRLEAKLLVGVRRTDKNEKS
jgi:uncharacterized RDD family membrane protein YckC